MDFIPAIQSGFKNAFKFTGRASRSEFWWFYLFFVLSMMATFMLSALVGGGIGAATSGANSDASNAGAVIGSVVIGIIGLYVLVMFLPILSLIFRRLHDSDKSAWFILLYFIPFGGIVLLVFYCLPGTLGVNKHGDDPLRPSIGVAKTFE